MNHMNPETDKDSKNRNPVSPQAKTSAKALLITALVTALGCVTMLYLTGLLSMPTGRSSSALSSSASHGSPHASSHGEGDGHDHPSDADLSQAADSTQLWTCGMHPWVITEKPGLCPICNMDLTPKPESTNRSASGDDGEKERTIVYWKAPMDPTEIYERPGKSKMGMDLVPVYENELVSGVDVSIDPVTEQNMGLRMEPVAMGTLKSTIRTYGHITYDETRTAQVSPKVSGWVEKLHVNFTGVRVTKGEALLEIYSPELLAAQEEYLSLFQTLKRRESGNIGFQNGNFLDSARRRLLYFDVAQEEIQAIETSGRTRKTLTMRSPFSGVVTFKNVLVGGYVKAGTTLYTITDLSRVWVDTHIYEYELDQVKVGQQATMTLPYLPGKTYTGTVTFIYPYLQQKTRDVVIRLEFDNPRLELKPEMFGDVEISTLIAEKGLQIPSEAVIRSGRRNVVFVSKGKGKFTPREITLGAPLDDGNLQVLTGLVAGEKVVTSGQFMLDSESKLQEVIKKMMALSNPSKDETSSAPSEKKPQSADEMDFFADFEMDEAEKNKAKKQKETNAADDFFKDME